MAYYGHYDYSRPYRRGPADADNSQVQQSAPSGSTVSPALTPSSSLQSTPAISGAPALSSSIPVPSISLSDDTIGSASEQASLTFTTDIPITTVTNPATTFTSFSQSIIIGSRVQPSASTLIPINVTSTPQNGAGFLVNTCAGSGIDAAASGVLTALVVPGLIGLILWLAFATLRPRFRQVYGLREWFVQPDTRPKPLGSGFFAWLFPPVPLIPQVPSDVSDAGRSKATDARLFPSDEQLTQRALVVALLIALGWSVLALAGALPLYIIGTPCSGELPSPATYGGGYSSLLDLSLLRLLQLIDSQGLNVVGTSSLAKRALEDDTFRSRTRVIILTALAIVLGVIPALWKIMREFNAVVEYRKRWLAVRCESKDLGWLSASKAPGFANWGEKRFKDYLVKIGLSSELGDAAKRNGGTRRSGRARRREEEQPLNDEDQKTEIDIQTLFSITDTQNLAILIDERDEILENLEIAETKYISSFRVTTPDPSVLDFVPSPPADPTRPYISRPLPLGPQRRSMRRRAVNRAYAASSFGPSSFVAPSSFYKLRGLQGVNGGRFTDSGADQTLPDSIRSRVIGSRFMEVNRNSQAYGRLPLGVHVGLEKDGELGPVSETGSWLPPIPDPRYHGPNYSAYEEEMVDEHGVHVRYASPEAISTVQEEEEWVDLVKETPNNDWQSDFNGTPPGTSTRRPRPPNKDSVTSTRRETFPLRAQDLEEEFSRNQLKVVPPPHLRLQTSQPFVRPLDGLNFDDLGDVYNDITLWRSRLKMINAEIAEVQRENYNDIASGQKIKGWLMVGKGLRFVPGVELIEGRAKEDIRWDVLQTERSWLDSAVLWVIIIVVMALLAVGLTAAAGLSLALAPDFAYYLPFLGGLLETHVIAAGVATVFAPAVAATVFIMAALGIINRAAKIHGSVSVSGNQLLVFKLTFFALAFIGTVWLVAIGALLYSMRAFDTAQDRTRWLANGSIYMSILALALVINVAIIVPACLLLQPFRLWNVTRSEKQAYTPRQRFRATYPRSYNPSYAMGACILAIVFASTFALIFPLIAPAVFIFLLLILIAHRFLIGYVYARTRSQTGGILQIWLLKRFGTLLSFQPILLGLVLLSRNFWIEGGVLVGTGVFVIIFVESYCAWKTRLPGFRTLSPITQNSVERFMSGADSYLDTEDENGNGSSARAGGGMRTRGSLASVLEMMSVTLAVIPSASSYRGAVPLQTENLDDLIATERAARTHPDAPPHLPPLPFTDHAEDMAGILYAPELIAPPPIIWLPNDSAGVARSEAVDLQKYHDLQVTLDVRAQEDVLRRSSSSRR
ncbi:hypothetical protein FA15DRAFT_754865 [Coprinopsis marcescibilis]|uniref:CSC1/OSCA1-like 7TM region domain-containing protein n=1 Tax=Coprinopsis marcescibilis TaxID=230819 RepID=A0A5C3L183_COPMA|nr:hypothetical protein FA15DRAFT_754865 [Coprinopsis marcescibilis]